MQLQPLHTLVMTAFHRANHGSTDEDLFGMLACLLCLLNCDAVPIRKAELSTGILFGRSPHAVGCVHEKLTPAELADRVPSTYIEAWPAQVKTGWKVFCFVLRLTEIALVEKLAVLHDEEHDTDMIWNEDETEEAIMALLEYEPGSLFEKQRVIGVLYAAVQAEFLTYKRLRGGDPWISANFSLSGLLQDFEEGNYDIPSIGLVAKKLLKPFTGCGAFRCRTAVPGANDACVHYFSNMDDWFRTKFIHFPDAYMKDL